MSEKYFEKQLNDFEEYLLLQKFSLSSLSRYSQALKCFLRFIVKKEIYDLREVITDNIRNYHKELIKKKYSLNTIYLMLRVIKRFFKFLEERHSLLYNPAEKISLPKLENRLPGDILSKEEVKQLLLMPNVGTDRGLRDRALMELLYSTGIRRKECENLTTNDIDYKEEIIRVNMGKGNKDRLLPLGKKACYYLRKYIENVRPRYIKDRTEVLFLGMNKKNLKCYQILVIVRKYAKEAKILKRVTVHGMRRAFATHLLRNGAHPMYIQRLLGHSSGETLKRYISVAGMEVKETHSKTHPSERNKK